MSKQHKQAKKTKQQKRTNPNLDHAGHVVTVGCIVQTDCAMGLVKHVDQGALILKNLSQDEVEGRTLATTANQVRVVHDPNQAD